MTISLFRFTGAELGDLKKKNHTERHFCKWLPSFCLRENNKLAYTETWLQFVDDGKEEYTMFEVEHTEQPLAEEISALGLEWLSDEMEIDFGFLKSLPFISYDRFNRSMNGNIQLVFDVTYSGDGGFYGDDIDIEIDLVGYLNEDKRLQEVD